MEKELAKLDEIALKIDELISLFSELSIDIKTVKSKGERHPIDAYAVARMLSKSRKMVYHLVAANAIPHHKRGARIFFFEDEITAWLEDNNAFKNRNLKFLKAYNEVNSLTRAQKAEILKQTLTDK